MEVQALLQRIPTMFARKLLACIADATEQINLLL
jgi:hypothetical protein